MPLPVLIVDDSSLARKHLARILPPSWDIELNFAEHGLEALTLIREGKGALTLLDLNMPVMDGYETLEQIKQHDLPALVIVISGDIQPEARSRVLQLGALEFIKKPTHIDVLEDILMRFGFFSEQERYQQELLQELETLEQEDSQKIRTQRSQGISVTERDVYQEVANVAMGRAGDLLAQAFGVFVRLPIPVVNDIAATELHMVLSSIDGEDTFSAVTQGFTGDGINGEAIVLFGDSSMQEIARLLRQQETHLEQQTSSLELLIDISNLVIGACLQGLGEQLHVRMNQAHPVLLGQHVAIQDLLKKPQKKWEQLLAIEIAYRIEGYQIEFNLLLLFPQASLPVLRRQLAYLMEDAHV